MTPGQQLSHYIIEDKIGEGGFGDVYRARDIQTSLEVAIKCAFPEGEAAKLADKKQRFMREISVISKLRHPNIVQLYDYGSLPDGTLFFVMEYVCGLGLDVVIKRDAPFSFTYAANIILQILDALSEAHAQSIVHRDLKPANIMLVKQGLRTDIVKLLDFGIAKAFDGSEPDLTHVSAGKNLGFGTPQYMPPEQFFGNQLGPHSDLYSVGLLFYELLTGKQAVSGDSISEIVRKQLHEFPIIPEPFSQGPLGEVFRCALAKNIEMRYASAQQMYSDIYAILRSNSPFLALYSSASQQKTPSSYAANALHMQPDNQIDMGKTMFIDGDDNYDEEGETLDTHAVVENAAKNSIASEDEVSAYNTMVFDDSLNLGEDLSTFNTTVFDSSDPSHFISATTPTFNPAQNGIVSMPSASSVSFGPGATIPNDPEAQIRTNDRARLSTVDIDLEQRRTAAQPQPFFADMNINSAEMDIATRAIPVYQDPRTEDLPPIFHQQNTHFIPNRQLYAPTRLNGGPFSNLIIRITSSRAGMAFFGSRPIRAIANFLHKVSRFIDGLYDRHFLALVIGVCLSIVFVTIIIFIIILSD